MNQFEPKPPIDPIRIIDLLFVTSDEEGNITALRIQDLASDLTPGLVELDTLIPIISPLAQALAVDLQPQRWPLGQRPAGSASFRFHFI